MTEEKEQEKITPENVFQVDIEKLALDSRFGSLVFENANKKLSKMQRWLKEAHDLGYKELLLEDEARQIDQLTNQLVEDLEWLRQFDIGSVNDAKVQHDQFEDQVDKHFNNVYKQVVKNHLPFLREENRRQNPEEKKLDDEVRKAAQLRSDLEKEFAQVREETEKIRTTGKEVGGAKGKRAAVRLATHFDTEATQYQDKADWWFRIAILGYVIVVGILLLFGWMAISYISALTTNAETTNTGMVLSVAATKLVIIAALWYGLSFVLKNYNVNSHLAATNRHRAAVARTLEDFLAVEQQQENPRLIEVLQNSAEAMFKNAPIGFISKTEKDSNQPVLKIVNDLMGLKNQ